MTDKSKLTPSEERIVDNPPPVEVASVAEARQRKADLDAQIAAALDETE